MTREPTVSGPVSASPPSAGSPGAIGLVGRSLLATALGIACARLLFPGQAGVIGVVLAAFGQAETARALLDRNREEIFGGLCTPRVANARLARALSAMFFGTFLAFIVAVQVTPWAEVPVAYARQVGDIVATSPRDLRFGDFQTLLTANLVVLLGSFLGAVLYEHAGMLLVLAWNAARWGAVISWVARLAGDGTVVGGASSLGRTLLAVLPHLAVEGTAYVLAAMGGVFLRRGVRRHAIDSPVFARVGVAVLRIEVGAVIALVAAAFLESALAPVLVRGLF